MSDRVLVSLTEGILTGTLNRPDKKNAIDTAMMEALAELLDRADLDAGPDPRKHALVNLNPWNVDVCFRIVRDGFH